MNVNIEKDECLLYAKSNLPMNNLEETKAFVPIRYKKYKGIILFPFG